MERSTKRRYAYDARDRNNGPMKRSRGGNQGKWQMPKAKSMAIQRGSIEPGDMGIWITCARNQEGKAAREMQILFDEYAELMYGVKQPGEGAWDDDEDEDIEASIQKELGSMGPQKTESRPFKNVRLNVECILFTKVRAPIDPVPFVHRICQDAAAAGLATDSEKNMSLAPKTRYVNRLTPISRCGRATEKGIELLARIVLAPHFNLKPATETDVKKENEQAQSKMNEQQPEDEGNIQDQAKTETDEQPKSNADKPAYSFAIRPSVRNNKAVKRDAIIEQVADLIVPDKHKVSLKNPDKVILIDVYQTVCGMSVVDGDWDTLKRYNLNELYNPNKPDQESEGPGGQPAKASASGAGESAT